MNKLNRNSIANARWKTDVTLQIQFYDLDPMGVVWHGRYTQYLETARCALFELFKYGYEAMQTSGYAWPVTDLHIRYINPITLGQHIKVCAALVEWENRLKVDYLITDAKTDKRLTRASTVQVAVDMTTQAMCFASPPVLLEKLELL